MHDCDVTHSILILQLQVDYNISGTSFSNHCPIFLYSLLSTRVSFSYDFSGLYIFFSLTVHRIELDMIDSRKSAVKDRLLTLVRVLLVTVLSVFGNMEYYWKRVSFLSGWNYKIEIWVGRGGRGGRVE